METCILNIQKKARNSGFTLIEVLLALAVIAIALTALLKASRQDVVNTQHLKNRFIGHVVAIHAARAVQLGLISPPGNQKSTKVTAMFGQKWYWQMKKVNVNADFLDAIEITVSQKKAGPFLYPIAFYRYRP